jgi:hypothetical protein
VSYVASVDILFVNLEKVVVSMFLQHALGILSILYPLSIVQLNHWPAPYLCHGYSQKEGLKAIGSISYQLAMDVVQLVRYAKLLLQKIPCC